MALSIRRLFVYHQQAERVQSLRNTVKIAALALVVLGLAGVVIYWLSPAPVILCYTEPCPQPSKDLRGVGAVTVGLLGSLAASIIVLGGKFPRAESLVLGVPSLITLAPGVAKYLTGIGIVQRNPDLVLTAREDLVTPVDQIAVVIGLALLVCAMCLLRRPRERAHIPLPAAVGAGASFAIVLLGVVPLLPEATLSAALLADQVHAQWWSKGTVAFPMSTGIRHAAVVFAALAWLPAVGTWWWFRAGGTKRRWRRLGCGLMGTLLAGLFCWGAQTIINLRQPLVGLLAGPFTSAGAVAMVPLLALLTLCCVLLVFWPLRSASSPLHPTSHQV